MRKKAGKRLVWPSREEGETNAVWPGREEGKTRQDICLLLCGASFNTPKIEKKSSIVRISSGMKKGQLVRQGFGPKYKEPIFG